MKLKMFLQFVGSFYEYSNFIKLNNFIDSKYFETEKRLKYIADISKVGVYLHNSETVNPHQAGTSRLPRTVLTVLLYSNMASRHLRTSRIVSERFDHMQFPKEAAHLSLGYPSTFEKNSLRTNSNSMMFLFRLILSTAPQLLKGLGKLN